MRLFSRWDAMNICGHSDVYTAPLAIVKWKPTATLLNSTISDPLHHSHIRNLNNKEKKIIRRRKTKLKQKKYFLNRQFWTVIEDGRWTILPRDRSAIYVIHLSYWWRCSQRELLAIYSLSWSAISNNGLTHIRYIRTVDESHPQATKHTNHEHNTFIHV